VPAAQTNERFRDQSKTDPVNTENESRKGTEQKKTGKQQNRYGNDGQKKITLRGGSGNSRPGDKLTGNQGLSGMTRVMHYSGALLFSPTKYIKNHRAVGECHQSRLANIVCVLGGIGRGEQGSADTTLCGDRGGKGRFKVCTERGVRILKEPGAWHCWVQRKITERPYFNKEAPRRASKKTKIKKRDGS